jgi:hypothetical protein
MHAALIAVLFIAGAAFVAWWSLSAPPPEQPRSPAFHDPEWKALWINHPRFMGIKKDDDVVSGFIDDKGIIIPSVPLEEEKSKIRRAIHEMERISDSLNR